MSEIQKRYDHFLKFIPQVAEFIKKTKTDSILKIEKKGRIDLVTQADKGSEKMITEEILKHFPDDSILGEEDGVVNGSSGYKWIIDPIDGTTNFAHNLPLYSISIGLEDTQKKEMVMGIVAMPDLGEIYHAIKGGGAYKNGQKINVSASVDLENSLLCTGFPQTDQKDIDRLGRVYVNLLKATRGVRRTGSAVLDLCWVAEGRFDGFYEYGLNPWDTAGPVAIILESGGKLSTIKGELFHPEIPSVVASNGNIHELIIQKIAEIK